jgi:hypothetical protein
MSQQSEPYPGGPARPTLKNG